MNEFVSGVKNIDSLVEIGNIIANNLPNQNGFRESKIIEIKIKEEKVIGPEKSSVDCELTDVIKWDDLIFKIKRRGFLPGFCKTFVDTTNSDFNKEKMMLFYNVEKGLIIYAESNCNTKYVSKARVHGEVSFKNQVFELTIDKILREHYLAHLNKSNKINVSLDITKELEFKFDFLDNFFNFSKKWSEIPYLYFVNAAEEQYGDFDLQGLTKRCIMASCKEIREIIGY